jgi:hypothetical protein
MSLSLELTPEVRETLRSEAFRALKALPRRGAEIGGFLTSAPDSVRVDAVELVESEHLYGPSYRLSPSDFDVFRQRVQAICGTRESQPLAYFRSCTREDCLLEPDDLSFIREVLPEAPFFLLLKPFHNGNSTVRVFSTADKQMLEEYELKMNFLAPQPEPAAVHPAPEFTPPPSPLPPKVDPMDLVSNYPARSNRSGSGYAWVGYVALAALFVIGGTWGIVTSSGIRPHPKSRAVTSGPAPPARANSDLGLRVEDQKDSFRVTWNRNLPALQNASGVLKIDDGREPRELELDQGQIATGSLLYVTRSSDLTFRMEVHGDQGVQLTERVRVVVSRPESKPEIARADPALPANRMPAPQPPPEDIRLPTGTGELVVPVVRSWPSAAPRAGSEYHPAHPLRRITPEIQASLLSKPAIVKVQVWVDDSGHVTEARELDSDPGAASTVPALAISASRQWTFEPAQSRGHNVPSDYRIVYWFTPHGS